MKAGHSHPILLFDGCCNYCNYWVNFIIRHDKKKKFRFTPLQSETGKKLLGQYNLSEKEESVILICDDKVYQKSAAALHALNHLGGFYPLFYVFLLTPEFIRDFFYDFISRNRHKWAEKNGRCIVPAEDARDRFL